MKKLLLLASLLMSVVVADNSLFDLPGESIKQFWIWSLNIIESKFDKNNSSPKDLIEVFTKTNNECFEMLFRKIAKKENLSDDGKCSDLNSNFIVLEKLPFSTLTDNLIIPKKSNRKLADGDPEPEPDVKNNKNSVNNQNPIEILFFKMNTLDVYLKIEKGTNFLFYGKNYEAVLEVKYGETEFGRIFVVINDTFFNKSTIPQDPPFILLNKWNFENLKFIEENPDNVEKEAKEENPDNVEKEAKEENPDNVEKEAKEEDPDNVENKAEQNKIHSLAHFQNILYHFNLKSSNSCSNQLRIVDSGLSKDENRDSFVYVNPHPTKESKCMIYALVEGPVWGVMKSNFKNPASKIEFFKNFRKIEEFRTTEDGNVTYDTDQNGNLRLNIIKTNELILQTVNNEENKSVDYSFKATFVLHEEKISDSPSKEEEIKDSTGTSLQITLQNFFSKETPFKILSKSFLEWMHKFLVSGDPSRKYVEPVGFSGFPKVDDLNFNQYLNDFSVTITIKMPNDDTISKGKNENLNNHIQPEQRDIDYSKDYPQFNSFPKLSLEEGNFYYFLKATDNIESFRNFDPSFDHFENRLELLKERFNDKKNVEKNHAEGNIENEFDLIEEEYAKTGEMTQFQANMNRSKNQSNKIGNQSPNKTGESNSVGNTSISHQGNKVEDEKNSKLELIRFDDDEEDDDNLTQSKGNVNPQQGTSQSLQNSAQPANKSQQTSQTPANQETATKATLQTTKPGQIPTIDPQSKPLTASPNQKDSSTNQTTLKNGNKNNNVNHLRRGFVI